MLRKELINSLKKQIVASVTAITVLVSGSTVCMAAAKPEIYVMYNTNYADENKPDEGWTLEGWKAEIDKTAAYVSNEMEYINNQLNSNGYYSPYVYDDNRAVTVTNCMGNAALFVFMGHGNPGNIQCKTSSGVELISARKTIGSLDADAYIPDDMRKCKVAYFASCYSAAKPKFGSDKHSIIGSCVENGADVSIGYEDTVPIIGAIYMASRIFTCHQFRTVADAVSYSIADIKNDFGGSTEWSRYIGNIPNIIKTKGNTGVKIVPASYGSKY